ncbi:hypothetical protein Ddc_00996 [Ditylenchus destructor]|nr:hypothetical protein Ddc_00996 [Ditylenchus destructor]
MNRTRLSFVALHIYFIGTPLLLLFCNLITPTQCCIPATNFAQRTATVPINNAPVVAQQSFPISRSVQAVPPSLDRALILLSGPNFTSLNEMEYNETAITNEASFNETMFNETASDVTMSVKVTTVLPLNSVFNPNLTFAKWRIDQKLEKMLGIERLTAAGGSDKARYKAAFEDAALPFSNPTWDMSIAPPPSWTYCQLSCGSGDQAVDAENASENAHSDVFSAINAALTSLNLSPIADYSLRMNYTAPSALLEELGSSYDKNNSRYRLNNGNVRHFVTENGKHVHDFVVQANVTIMSDSLLLHNTLWKKVSTSFTDFLTREKHVYFYAAPNLISYKRSNVALSLLPKSF